MDVDGPSKKSRKEKHDGEFRSVKASIVLAVPPVFANRLRDGVEEMLDTMIMR
jgi:DNA-directed RNA polymerase I subunit RPA43